MLNIVIFGAPGSGKGTQSERIVEKFGINHISTGDVLRAEIKKGTELGKTAKGYIDQGQLLPDELIIDILASTLDSFKESKGVIFDGFPRTIAQAEALKKMLAERGQEVSVIPFFPIVSLLEFLQNSNSFFQTHILRLIQFILQNVPSRILGRHLYKFLIIFYCLHIFFHFNGKLAQRIADGPSAGTSLIRYSAPGSHNN